MSLYLTMICIIKTLNGIICSKLNTLKYNDRIDYYFKKYKI